MESPFQTDAQWLRTSETALAAMLAAIADAQSSVRLEMYVFAPSRIADEFRDALTSTARKGLRVRVLIDALGSMSLSDSFWEGFRASGGEVRRFNPASLNRFAIRDHRKLLVCDDQLAFIGGFNIATEYQGDGITSGWRDLGLKIRGPITVQLAAAFDEMFDNANFQHKTFPALRKSFRQKSFQVQGGRLLLTGPGRNNLFKLLLRHDLRTASEAVILCAYFLPPLRIRRAIIGVVRRGGRVRLILPGKSDVPVSVMAARSLYRRFLKAGVEIYEYQPQILHAKLSIIDDIVYAGSSNLDPRSLHINYELVARIPDPALAAAGREIASEVLSHCRRIDPVEWKRSRNFWDRLKGRAACWVLMRLDPYIARRSS